MSLECGRWRRLLKKRELIAYYVLCSDGARDWNVGEAVDVLMNKLYLDKKTAFNIFRRFVKMGLLNKFNELNYRCYGFMNYIDELYRNYICRKKRRLKTV